VIGKVNALVFGAGIVGSVLWQDYSTVACTQQPLLESRLCATFFG